MEAAHEVGFKTTATVMYGHVEKHEHLARHLLRIRAQQVKTGGFTEFVPLPFIHMEAPMYSRAKRAKAQRSAKQFYCTQLHVLALHGQIDNIQASWVKMGHKGYRGLPQCRL